MLAAALSGFSFQYPRQVVTKGSALLLLEVFQQPSGDLSLARLVGVVAGEPVGGDAGAGGGPGERLPWSEDAAVEDVGEEAGHIARVEGGADASFKVAEGVQQDGAAGLARFQSQPGELVAVAPGADAQLLDQVQVLFAQQVQGKDAALDQQMVRVVGLPDVDEDARALA